MCEMIAEMGQRQAESDTRQAESDARMQDMMQAIAALSLQNQMKEEGGNHAMVKGDWGRNTRYEFPKFDGEGFEGWLMRAEYFFEVAEMPVVEKVRIAALHLEGRALQWHRGFVTLHGERAYVSWNNYIRSMAARFGAHAYEDPLSDLRNLKQTNSLQAYMDEFEELYPRTGIREDQALSFFLSGLIDELQMPVRMFKPASLADAYALAKLQELTVRAMSGKIKGSAGGSSYASNFTSGNKAMTVTTSTYKPSGGNGSSKEFNRAGNNKMGPKLSTKEMDERRAKGLCYWCPERYSPGHNCGRRKAYVIHLVDEEGEEEEEAEGMEKEMTEDLQLSLHALWGIEGLKVMRIRGQCQKKFLRVLIDTGSTHNFLGTQMAERIDCKLIQVATAAVEVANGQMLQCSQKCKEFQWEMQGFKFTTEVHLIPLETYDLILGVQWLSTLGNIVWNFNTLSMEFEVDGVECTLQGEKWTSKNGQILCLTLTEQYELQDGAEGMEELRISQVMTKIEGVK